MTKIGTPIRNLTKANLIIANIGEKSQMFGKNT